MKLWSLLGNGQRLDGGAMFGNVPRALWSRWYEPDEDHRIDLACRAMLICDEQGRNILETGIGAFFEPKLKSRFGVQSDRHLLLETWRQLVENRVISTWLSCLIYILTMQGGF